MRAFLLFAAFAITVGGCYLSHELPVPDAGVDLGGPDAPVDLGVDGPACGCGFGTRCCPLCPPAFECLDPAMPCPVPDCPQPQVCPDGTECGLDDMCCPECNGRYICESRIFMLCPDVDCPTCWPMDAEATGSCTLFLGVAWNGSECAFLSGCACEGRDCGGLFPTLAACLTTYQACVLSDGDGPPAP